MRDAPWIAVVGAGGAIDSTTERAAEAVGRELAQHAAVLVCGGLGGVMAAACRGASSVGGTTVGLLPGLDRGEANPWVQVPIATGLGELRNGLLVRTADALVAVGGAWGTLSEIALALATGKAVVGLGSWELAAAGTGVIVAREPPEAVREALARVSLR